jgi:hypothetical protein
MKLTGQYSLFDSEAFSESIGTVQVDRQPITAGFAQFGLDKLSSAAVRYQSSVKVRRGIKKNYLCIHVFSY